MSRLAVKKVIYTNKAPEPIGPYSQAIDCGNMIFISGQIPINPETNQVENNTIEEQVTRVFKNLAAICEGANISLQHIVKLNLYLTNLSNFNIVNEIMANFFSAPYPARAAIEVSALPKGVDFEAEAVAVKDI